MTSWLNSFFFSTKQKLRKHGPPILSFPWRSQLELSRKVTTGTSRLWQPSVHTDCAASSCGVGSSYLGDRGETGMFYSTDELHAAPWSWCVVLRKGETLVHTNFSRAPHGRTTFQRRVRLLSFGTEVVHKKLWGSPRATKNVADGVANGVRQDKLSNKIWKFSARWFLGSWNSSFSRTAVVAVTKMRRQQSRKHMFNTVRGNTNP